MFRGQSVSSVTDKIGLLRQQRFELIFILHKVGDILRLHAEDSRVSLCQDLGLVFTQVGRDEVLPDEIFRLHHISVTDDESDRAVQCIQQSIQMRCNMSTGTACAQHDDLNGTFLRKPHKTIPLGRSDRSASIHRPLRRGSASTFST